MLEVLNYFTKLLFQANPVTRVSDGRLFLILLGNRALPILLILWGWGVGPVQCGQSPISPTAINYLAHLFVFMALHCRA